MNVRDEYNRALTRFDKIIPEFDRLKGIRNQLQVWGYIYVSETPSVAEDKHQQRIVQAEMERILPEHQAACSSLDWWNWKIMDSIKLGDNLDLIDWFSGYPSIKDVGESLTASML